MVAILACIDRVWVRLHSDPAANGGIGTVAVWNFYSEGHDYHNCLFEANLPYRMTRLHKSPGLPGEVRSPYVKFSEGDGCSLLGMVFSGQCTMVAFDYHRPCLYSAGAGSIDLGNTYMSLRPGPQPQPRGKFLYCVENAGCVGYRHYATMIREAHYNTFAALRKAGDKNIGFAASDDMRRAWYHPQIKIPVGERIARWALATQYGVNRRWLPPTVKAMKVDGNKIIVTLDTEAYAYNSGPIYGFAIAGRDKKFYPAQANYLVDEKKNTIRSVIVLSSPFVAEPVAYRYGWHRNPMGNLKISSCELSLPISRSDNWSLNDLYEAYTGKKTASETEISRAERAALDRALQTADRQRRFKEAEAYVQEHQADKGKGASLNPRGNTRVYFPTGFR